MFTDKQTLEAVIADLDRELAYAKRRLADLDNPYGEEPAAGHVLKWQVRYDSGGKWYTYLAHRSENGFWYTTAADTKRYTWGQLRAEWAKRGVPSNGIQVMTTWKVLKA